MADGAQKTTWAEIVRFDRSVLSAAAPRLAAWLCAVVGISALGDAIQQIQKTFSGGQRRRLGLIRALLRPAPALLVLDEPTAALDASAQALVMDLISPLKHRCPVLMATHRPSTMTYADRVVRLEDGRAVVKEANTNMTDGRQNS